VVGVRPSDIFYTLSVSNACFSNLGTIAKTTNNAVTTSPISKYVYLFNVFMLNQKLSITL